MPGAWAQGLDSKAGPPRPGTEAEHSGTAGSVALRARFHSTTNRARAPTPAPAAQLGMGETQMLDKILYEEEVRRCIETFEQQFHYGIFYAYMRLRCVAGGVAGVGWV